MPAVTLEKRNGVAVLTLDNPPVNALGQAVRAGLDELIRQAGSDAEVDAVVITSLGKAFIAGADIREFNLPPQPPSLPEVMETLDRCEKPIVAAMDGAALGGGLEVALACDFRLATPRSTFGLPEVKLGLLPGAGGTQRLPRLIDPATALSIMLDGEPRLAGEARQLGLIDEIVEGDGLLEAAITFATERAAAGAKRRLSERRPAAEARAAMEEMAAESLKRHPGEPQIEAIVECVRAAFDETFADAAALERKRFFELKENDRSKALRHAFFAERESGRKPRVAEGAEARPVENVAVIGGGTMGSGIAMAFLDRGIPVTIVETDEAGASRSAKRIEDTYGASASRGRITEAQKEERLALLAVGVGLEKAAAADLVVEAAFEDMEVKRSIFSALDGIAKPGAVLATNTSYLDVNEIAAATGRPGDVLGMHFFSPANVMTLVEVVRGRATSDDALLTAIATAKRLRKMPVVVGVCHGFVGNRMLARRSEQVDRLLLEGAAPSDIDDALAEFGFRMGPCAVGDLAGLDIGWRMRKATGKKAPAADALCEAGRFGQKTGSGYYRYPEGARKGVPDPQAEEIIRAAAEREGIERREVAREEIVPRLLYPMINEGARILEEGIVDRPADIDAIWLHGYAWPRWRGGPMYYADRIGLATVAAELECLSNSQNDESLAPSALLARLAAERRGFHS